MALWRGRLAQVIVDSSALLAIVRREPDRPACFHALFDSPTNRLSAANYLEASLVVDGPGDTVASRALDELLDEFAIAIEPVTAHQALIARRAHQRFGKGTGHPARLNFGDCFAYALAIHYDEPLLFIGNDFVHTDVRRVLG
jgi:ribonuclease VapC